MQNKRLRILVSAYACCPNAGSEPGVGWGFVNALAEMHDLWVLVEKCEFEESVRKFLHDNPGSLRTVRFLFIPRKRNLTLEKLYPPSYYSTYRKWHLDAYLVAKNLHKSVKFDVSHQLNMVGFREPGFLWQLGIPFVWGPIGGMGLFPWRFLSSIGAYGALYYVCYNIFNSWQLRFSRRPRLAATATPAGAGLIVATPENQAGVKRYWGYPSTLISEVGLPPAFKASEPVPRLAGEPLRIVWAGLHVPRKALNLGLKALSTQLDQLWELDILGEGARTAVWKAQTEQLGIAERCRFHGWVLRNKALAIMSTSHVMLITSLHDLTSTVTIEALAMGLPIVCLDHCGFAGVVDASCGIKVRLDTPTTVVAGLASGIARLAENEALRFKLAQGAIRRARDFSWEKKAEVVNQIYNRVLDEHQAVVS